MTTKLESSEYLHFANERHATSSGFGFSMYNLFKPSIIDATALGGSWARDDERGDTLGNKWKLRHNPLKWSNCTMLCIFIGKTFSINGAIQGTILEHGMHVREAPKGKAYIVYQKNLLPNRK